MNTYSTEEIAKKIMSGGKWNTRGTRNILTYSINSKDFTEQQVDAIHAAFEKVEPFTPLKFYPAPSGEKTDISIHAHYFNSPILGDAFYPFSSNLFGMVFNETTGNSAAKRIRIDPGMRNHSFLTTVLHEIGHALGLRHADFLSANTQETVMYPTRGTTRLQNFGPADILALQQLYGVNHPVKQDGRVFWGRLSGGTHAAVHQTQSGEGDFLLRAGQPALKLSIPQGTLQSGIPVEPVQWIMATLAPKGTDMLTAVFVERKGQNTELTLQSIKPKQNGQFSYLKTTQISLDGVYRHSPVFVSSADLNGDGITDLIISAGHWLSFQIGDGQGGFAAAGSRVFTEDREHLAGNPGYRRLAGFGPAESKDGRRFVREKNGLFTRNSIKAEWDGKNVIHQAVASTEREQVIAFFQENGTVIFLKKISSAENGVFMKAAGLP